MLTQVLLEIESAHNSLNLSELSHKLDIDRSALDGMIQFWVRKGKLRDDDADLAAVMSTCSPPSCGGSCAGMATCPFIAKMPKTYSIPSQKND
ncbi:MAG: hypothetical protein KAU23_05305 [Anaerolineales bacterium]|nr:hypothetical protein [Anaerolineales bacterium]